MIKKYSHFA